MFVNDLHYLRKSSHSSERKMGVVLRIFKMRNLQITLKYAEKNNQSSTQSKARKHRDTISLSCQDALRLRLSSLSIRNSLEQWSPILGLYGLPNKQF